MSCNALSPECPRSSEPRLSVGKPSVQRRSRNKKSLADFQMRNLPARDQPADEIFRRSGSSDALEIGRRCRDIEQPLLGYRLDLHLNPAAQVSELILLRANSRHAKRRSLRPSSGIADIQMSSQSERALLNLTALGAPHANRRRDGRPRREV